MSRGAGRHETRLPGTRGVKIGSNVRIAYSYKIGPDCVGRTTTGNEGCEDREPATVRSMRSPTFFGIAPWRGEQALWTHLMEKIRYTSWVSTSMHVCLRELAPTSMHVRVRQLAPTSIHVRMCVCMYHPNDK